MQSRDRVRVCGVTNVISFCLITRNCAKTLPATLASIKPVADEVCIVDTGSTDRTVEIARAAGARVEIHGPAEHPDWFMEIPDSQGGTQITLAEFSQARNRSFDMAKGETIFWIDADDTLSNLDAWPELVQTFRASGVDAMILPYDYMFDNQGRCTTVLWRERLLKNRPDLRWIDPVHETIPVFDKPFILHRKVRVVHHKHERTDVNVRRNLEVLKVRSTKDNPRTLFYLGVEHVQAQEFKEAAIAFEDYLKVSFDQDETYHALFYLGDLHRVFGSWEASIAHYQKASVLQPRWRDAYVGMAMTFAAQRDWPRAVHYAEQAKGMEAIPHTALPVNPEFEKVGWIAPLARGYQGLGRHREALETVMAGLQIQPDNAEILSLRENCMRQVNRESAQGAHQASVEALLRNDDGLKAAQVAQLVGDESELGLTAKQAYLAAHMDLLPGRTFTLPDMDDYLEDQRLRWFLEWMGQRPRIRTVASPGCGSGLFSIIAHELLGKSVTAWDPDPWPAMNLGGVSAIAPSGHRLIVQHKDLQQPATTKHDLVILENVLEHAARPEDILKMAIAFARPGGTMLVVVPESPFDPEGPSPSLTNLRLRPFSSRTLKALTGTWQAPVKVRDLSGRPSLMTWIDLPLGTRLTPRRVGILCGDAVEPWDWTAVERGCGASEEAVIRVARILTERGHTVTVFGAGVGEDTGPWGTVQYARRTDYTPQDICVVWRSPELLLQRRAPEAEWHWLWLQDNLEPAIVEAAAARCDRVLLMSAWHGTLYPFLRNKAEIVGNGIQRDEVIGDVGNRKANRFIWASCPTRGLDTLLEAWPRIRERSPGAELHVYYGLEMIKSVMAHRPPEIQTILAQKIAKIEGLRNQVGVEWMGRVSVAAVSEAMKGAGVWAYPVDFDEAFCAAAARAQACGCWPVVYNRAALAETVAWGRVATADSFVDDCIAMAQNSEDRNGMRAWARSAFAWERVADKFERMMEEL